MICVNIAHDEDGFSFIFNLKHFAEKTLIHGTLQASKVSSTSFMQALQENSNLNIHSFVE